MPPTNNHDHSAYIEPQALPFPYNILLRSPYRYGSPVTGYQYNSAANLTPETYVRVPATQHGTHGEEIVLVVHCTANGAVIFRSAGTDCTRQVEGIAQNVRGET